jgi:hypothetical protein
MDVNKRRRSGNERPALHDEDAPGAWKHSEPLDNIDTGSDSYEPTQAGFLYIGWGDAGFVPARPMTAGSLDGTAAAPATGTSLSDEHSLPGLPSAYTPGSTAPIAHWLPEPASNGLNSTQGVNFSPHLHTTYLEDPFAPLESLFGSQSRAIPYAANTELDLDTLSSWAGVTTNPQYVVYLQHSLANEHHRSDADDWENFFKSIARDSGFNVS